MALYIGFWTYTPAFSEALTALLRQGLTPGEQPLGEEFLAKVQAFPDALPAGCELLDSFAPEGLAADPTIVQKHPGVDLFQTRDPDRLISFATEYYDGYLTWQFYPYAPV